MMRSISKIEISALLVTAMLAAGVAVSTLFFPQEEVEQELRTHINAVLQLDEVPGRNRALVVGYNYFLMQKYAESNGQTIDIRLAEKGTSYIDSLKRGKLDMLALPMHLKGKADSVLYSSNIDSLSVWLMQHDDHHHMRDLKRWLREWKLDDSYEETKALFLNRFNPFRSRQRSRLSPYDDIIRNYSDSLGWDWRMLAAVIYQESRFHIEARSHRGASGIMQMMPRNAARYGITDPLDPEQNIRAGSQMLSRLTHRYRSISLNEQENFKFALAAYNAGIGRMRNLINFAREKEANTAVWDSLATLIPEMNEKMAADTSANYIEFKGDETVAYVNNVFAVYEQFKRICPE